jgi:hypothetical protein
MVGEDGEGDKVVVERWRTIASVRWEAMVGEVE